MRVASLMKGQWLKPGAIVVLEEQLKADVPEVTGLILLDKRDYGDTQVRFYRHGM